MDIRRTFLWVLLTFSLVMLWGNWQAYQDRSKQIFSTPPSQIASPATNRTNDQLNSPPAASHSPIPEIKAEKIHVQTDVLSIDISTQGGALIYAELRKHKENGKDSNNIVLFDQSPNRQYEAQTGLVDVPNAPTHRTIYHLISKQSDLIEGQNTLEVILEAESGGIKDRLTYTFRRGSYVIAAHHEITNLQTQPIVPSLYVQLVRDGNKPPGESKFYSTFTGPAIYSENTKFHKVSFSDIEKGKTNEIISVAANEPGWISMLRHYFVTAWVLPFQMPRNIYTEKIGENLYRVGMKQSLGPIAAGASKTVEAKLYVGPQDQDILTQLAPGLDLVVDYGWLTFIAKPIFWFLQWLHKLVGNWGWAIVLLTILIKLAFYPLSAIGYKSMARMKNLAPRLTAMKERYKDDRMKMQQAMMELYRVEKINPMGGCLPILIQIPVFIALYWVLLGSVEIRNAPWIGWIHNLAAPDPFYILPIIMMMSMFVQYKLNPTPPDPMQAKIMLWMPLVFGVMFFFFPAGLVLYWVVNNILSIVQQWSINKQLEKAGLK